MIEIIFFSTVIAILMAALWAFIVEFTKPSNR